jgi:hypothetical protein
MARYIGIPCKVGRLIGIEILKSRELLAPVLPIQGTS